MKKIKEIINGSISVKQLVLADETLLQTVEQVVAELVRAFSQGNRVFFCGNGGSAADAQHLAAEFSGRFYSDRRALPAEALHCNTSYLTAVANDYGFDQVYSRMIEGTGQAGDVLIGLTTSGNSSNIYKAFEAAKQKQMATIGFTGITGGQLRSVSDYLLNIPSSDTPRIQECHTMIGHVICEMVEEKLFPQQEKPAQKELPLQKLRLEDIDSSWTIFIDRDGVINSEKKDDYIRNKDEFHFYEGVPEAFQILAKKTGLVIIVSNQQGVGKGLMTEEDLLAIHQIMQAEIEKAGGRVDSIYYCTHTDPLSPQRKPNPGMAWQAKLDFPGIDFRRSIMVGNKPSDMLFGRNAGMHTIFIASTHPETPFPHPDIDLRFNSLAEFVKAL